MKIFLPRSMYVRFMLHSNDELKIYIFFFLPVVLINDYVFILIHSNA